MNHGNLLCRRIFITSSGCTTKVESRPAVRPAHGSTTEEGYPRPFFLTVSGGFDMLLVVAVQTCRYAFASWSGGGREERWSILSVLTAVSGSGIGRGLESAMGNVERAERPSRCCYYAEDVIDQGGGLVGHYHHHRISPRIFEDACHSALHRRNSAVSDV
jgi:hypothetical protein